MNDLLWIREAFLDWTGRHDKVVVHGHTISRTPEVRPSRIGIDTGAFAIGVLTSLVLARRSPGLHPNGRLANAGKR